MLQESLSLDGLVNLLNIPGISTEYTADLFLLTGCPSDFQTFLRNLIVYINLPEKNPRRIGYYTKALQSMSKYKNLLKSDADRKGSLTAAIRIATENVDLIQTRLNSIEGILILIASKIVLDQIQKLNLTNVNRNYLDEEGVVQLRKLEALRIPFESSIKAAIVEIFTKIGILESEGYTSRNIISIGCGAMQVERFIWGNLLEKIKSKIIGVDIIDSKLRPQASNIEFLQMDMLDPSLLDRLDGVDLLLDIDGVSEIHITPETLDRYINLIKTFKDKNQNGKYVLLLTFPASRNWTSQGFISSTSLPAEKFMSFIKQQNLIERSGDIFSLSKEDLEVIADALLPLELTKKIIEQNDFSLLFDYLSQITRKYMVDGVPIWGSIFSIVEAIRPYIENDRRTIAEALKNYVTPLLAIKDFPPELTIFYIFSLLNEWTSMGLQFDDVAKGYMKEDKLVTFGGTIQLTFTTALNALQAHILFTLLDFRLKKAGLYPQFISADSSVVTPNISASLREKETPNFFPSIITDRKFENFADQLIWMLGFKLFNRRQEATQNIEQRARVIALVT